MVSVDGRISTVAGDGTLPVGRTPDTQMPGPAARLGQVREVAVHPDGRLFFIESFVSVRRAPLRLALSSAGPWA